MLWVFEYSFYQSKEPKKNTKPFLFQDVKGWLMCLADQNTKTLPTVIHNCQKSHHFVCRIIMEGGMKG